MRNAVQRLRSGIALINGIAAAECPPRFRRLLPSVWMQISSLTRTGGSAPAAPSCVLPSRLFQPVPDEDSASLLRVVDHHLGRRANELSVLEDGRAADGDVNTGQQLF